MRFCVFLDWCFQADTKPVNDDVSLQANATLYGRYREMYQQPREHSDEDLAFPVNCDLGLQNKWPPQKNNSRLMGFVAG